MAKSKQPELVAFETTTKLHLHGCGLPATGTGTTNHGQRFVLADFRVPALKPEFEVDLEHAQIHILAPPNPEKRLGARLFIVPVSKFEFSVPEGYTLGKKTRRPRKAKDEPSEPAGGDEAPEVTGEVTVDGGEAA